ncbi:hypothetical protein Bca52824_032213 [Brassica carinata]|uniref:Uncharacterized protein n=1 Tax=Brassica carinata TaxID=52824 RepID=A0A8X7SC27_BRACI|nr:hypothetical protein Bca52824_032213 [Brassica carinata]
MLLNCELQYFNPNPNPYSEDEKLTKTFTFLDEGTTKITATPIRCKEDKGLPNGVNHEKSGNKHVLPEESFFTWFSDAQHKEDLDVEINDKVAGVIKEDLWPNPLTYFNNEADEEDFDEEDDDEEGKEGDSDEDDDEKDKDGEE